MSVLDDTRDAFALRFLEDDERRGRLTPQGVELLALLRSRRPLLSSAPSFAPPEAFPPSRGPSKRARKPKAPKPSLSLDFFALGLILPEKN